MPDHPSPVLMRADTIRSRSAAISQWVESGQSDHWRIHPHRLEAAAQAVVALTRERFPDLDVPFHSRWRHFEAGGVNRTQELLERLAKEGISHDSAEALRARLDLCVVSVLLDAGSGASWSFTDRQKLTLSRSEGLGVASLEAFLEGQFANSKDLPLRADAARLATLDLGTLAEIFQVHGGNPLAGLEGRLQLLNRLGRSLLENGQQRIADIYAEFVPARADPAQPSNTTPQAPIAASHVLETTVAALAPVWLKASTAPDGSRGDLWPHPAARSEGGTEGASEGWVPFHKLSQWLCYSLIEPLREAGLAINSLDTLTGLPEYRNGGLMMDYGVISLRDPSLAQSAWTPDDRLIIEWRALTVTLIDRLAVLVRDGLQRTEQSLPLACILEGGTWLAGRRSAERLRAGRPPLEVDTAGTVF